MNRNPPHSYQSEKENHTMQICKAKDYEDMSQKAARILFSQITLKPDCVLGLATGSSPVGAYQRLVQWHQEGELDFSRVTSVNLDEYRGLSGEHDQSYRYFMNHHLFDHVNIAKERTFVPDGLEEDPARACARYNEILRSVGQVDLQLLGLGRNGHIGFNEPGDCFVPDTHCVDLTESTIEANKRFFASEDLVPRQAYTMGVKNILDARRILLVVSGYDKADALKSMVEGPITPQVPASILQLHRRVTIVADEQALSKLSLG